MKIFSFLLVTGMIFLSGCTATYRYKLLSFFFDGVPNPATDTALHPADTLSRSDTTTYQANGIAASTPQMHIHSPYREKECAACHDNSIMGRFTKATPDLCYQCHDDFSETYKVLHSPVAEGQCTQCHSPHQSANANLLIRTNRAICFLCHDSDDVLKSETHEDIQDADCTECHNPHGGEDKYVLR